MSIINQLIYDRTENDLYNDTDKAYISYNDLNRIETAVKFISDLLNQMGYTNTTNNKLDWGMRDIRTEAQADRIKENYTQIKNAYDRFNLPDFEWANINEANDIERILWQIYYNLQTISNYFIKSNVANAGQNRVWQQRFRRGSNIARLNSRVEQYNQSWDTVTSPSTESLDLDEINEFSKISSAINSWNSFLNSLDSEVGNIEYN
jgi:hypothetical protein